MPFPLISSELTQKDIHDFLNWVEESQGWVEANRYRLSHTTDWLETELGQYWLQNIRPEIQKKELEAAAQKELKGKTFEEASTIIKKWAAEGVTTQENVNAFWQKYVVDAFDPAQMMRKLAATNNPEKAIELLQIMIEFGEMTEETASDYLVGQFPDEFGKEISPIVRRERQIELDKSMTEVLASPNVSKEEKDMLQGEEGQRLQEAYLKGGSGEILGVLEDISERAGIPFAKKEAERVRKAQEKIDYDIAVRKQKKEAFWNLPLEVRGKYGAFKGEEELPNVYQRTEVSPGVFENIPLKRPTAVNEEYEYQQMMKRRAMGMPGGLKVGGRAETDWLTKYYAKQRRAERPPLSSPEDIVKQFAEGTGLAKGTKLRQFMEGEVIPGAVEETKAAREAWWNRLKGVETRTSPLYGADEYYDPRTRERRLFELAEETIPRGWLKTPTEKLQKEFVGEDPLKAALRKKKLRPEYFRQPGAGLVSRLTPSIRF